MDSTAVRILRSQDGGPGPAGGQKIENDHMVDCSHVNLFSRTEFHPDIDSARLENHKRSFKNSKWGEKMPFSR